MWMLAILQLSVIFRSEAMVVGPRNTAVIVGQKMEMKCQVDNDSTVSVWSLQRTLTSPKETLYLNWNTKTLYYLNWNTKSMINNTHFGLSISEFGSLVLYANSTTLDDAGIYICSIRQQRSKSIGDHRANLVVFEAEPRCHSNSTVQLPLSTAIGLHEETYVSMQCTVNFRGNLVPDFEWREHEGHGEEYEEGRKLTKLADTVIIPNSSITSELTVFFNSNVSRLSYAFRLFFRTSNESQLVNATNAPDYSYTWKIHVVKIPSTSLEAVSEHRMILMAVGLAASLVSASLVAVIICCIRRRKHDNEQLTERTIAKSKEESPMPVRSRGQNSEQLQQYIGDDGTEYMEVNKTNRQPMPIRLRAETNTFSVVGEYACVDHTARPPMLLPREKVT